MIALGYLGGKASRDFLYQWSTAPDALISDGVLLFLALAIAGFSTRLLALRRPRSTRVAALLAVSTLATILAFEALNSSVIGNDQHLTPAHWEPRHAAAYVVNGIVLCTWVPFVEEVIFRGLGYSLLERLGRWPAILLVGVVFGLAHGVVEALPVLIAFGSALTWLRSRTESILPGMVLHGLFNLIAVVFAVVTL